MAVRLKPTEFGGTTQRNGIAPPTTPRGHTGHTELAAYEKLRLEYLTGQSEDSTAPPDNGEAFEGLEPIEIAREKAPKPSLWIEENDA